MCRMSCRVGELKTASICGSHIRVEISPGLQIRTNMEKIFNSCLQGYADYKSGLTCNYKQAEWKVDELYGGIASCLAMTRGEGIS